MTLKKKAEMQRKLGMAPVATPPPGLLERLKSDIPENLMNVDRDRRRLSGSMSSTLRIAASVILLVTSAFVGVKVLTRGDLAQTKLGSDSISAPARSEATVEATDTGAAALKREMKASDAATDEAIKPAPVAESLSKAAKESAQKVQNAAPVPASRQVDYVATPTAVVAPTAAAPPLREDQALAARPPATGGVVGGVIGGIVTSPAPREEIAPEALAVGAPAPPPPPAAAPPALADAAESAAPRQQTERRVKAVTAVSAASLTVADPQAVRSPRSLFGLSIDPSEFGRIKGLIERGEKPAAASVNINALVNHFAGPGRPRIGDVRLQVEGSSAPLATGAKGMLRYSIDTAPQDRGGRRFPLAGTGGVLDITLNHEVIESYRVLADRAALHATERQLAADFSATGLIEIQLKPSVSDRARVATIRLQYRSARTGQQVVLSEDVNVRELRGNWLQATPRHRLATLGAVWGGSLNGPPPADEVERTAKALATDAPGSAQAKDLAAAASASSRLRSSGPTGSER